MLHQLTFGPVTISWDAAVCRPIALEHRALNGHVRLVTECEITYRYGRHTLLVPRGYAFDGATIPRWFWWIPGFAPIGKHIWAALAHDWICDHPEELPRAIGDAIFATLLEFIRVGRWRRLAMVAAVRGWSLYRALKGSRR